jgi:formylglycine-generating enzyme required for sulfatase activity
MTLNWIHTALALLVALASGPMVRVGPGIYRPFYPLAPGNNEIAVAAFQLDVFPVTNGQMLEFVRAHPNWQRGRVGRLFADAAYLSHWTSPLELGPQVDAQQPVVHVSWFAAKAYCASRGARLPLEQEWELAAAASQRRADGRRDARYREQIAAWYSRPNPARLPRVGSTPKNYWGVADLHGLVWEWVLDFNATLVSADDREGGDKDKLRFCGAGALSASDKTDYPSFMRIAMRSSLRADFTTANLGFRCAR